MDSTVKYGCPICKDSWSKECMKEHLDTAKIQRTFLIQQLHTLDYSIKAGEHFNKHFNVETVADTVQRMFSGEQYFNL